MISPAIIVLDEEENIQVLFDNLMQYSNILANISVVDCGSSDNTVDVILSYKDKLDITLQIVPQGDCLALQRNMAGDGCRGEWKLKIDADEFVEGLDLVKTDGYDCVFLPLRYLIKDNRHYIPSRDDYKPRLYRNNTSIMWSGKFHENLVGYSNPQTNNNTAIIFERTFMMSDDLLRKKARRYLRFRDKFGKFAHFPEGEEHYIQLKKMFIQNEDIKEL